MKYCFLNLFLIIFLCNTFIFASYKIDRLEIVKNKGGKNELFFSVKIKDELGDYVFGKWLGPDEFAVYKKNNLKIKEIIEKYLPTAKQNKIDEIEYTKKHPPIFEELK